MTHQHQIQKPAQASSKAMFDSQNNPKAEMQKKALENAVTGAFFCISAFGLFWLSNIALLDA